MNRKRIIINLLLSASLVIAGMNVNAQSGKRKISLKDSLDGAFDLSSFLIDANGFIPVPYTITEPAIGGFGLALAPVFLKKRAPMERNGKYISVPPDITAGAVGYTANKSWFVGGGRSGTISKWGVRYKIAMAYADLNLSFYHSFPTTGEKEFKFNFKIIPVYLFAVKQLGFSNWFAGLQYLFLNSKVKMQNGTQVPEFVTKSELNSNVSELGILGEYDSRDNIFTPNKGFKGHAHLNWSNDAIGSDYDYERLNGYLHAYIPFYQNKENGKNWISGFRADYQQVFGNAPFYLLPYISLRGVPSARYQGKMTTLIETEQRWDFIRRWSAVFFGGLGKAFDDFSEFSDKPWVYTYGFGGRYLLARKFDLRMGIDVARGPEQWAYYIIFGSSWLR